MGLVDREHLPECPQAKRYGMPCICPELHACELRMMQREYLLDEGDPYREVYRAGYSRGIADALESAEWCQDPDEILQAIAALHEINPTLPPPLPPSVGVPQKWGKP